MSDTQLSELTDAVNAIGGRLDSMDKKFDSMDKRFNSIDKRFGAMDKRFDSIDKKFGAMDKRFNSMEKKFDDQFLKLYKRMNKEFGKVHKRLDQTATKDQFNTYVNAVDAFAKQTETYHQEMDALGNKVDRHERWHEQTAKTVGIKLTA